jgi:hypothetical protein
MTGSQCQTTRPPPPPKHFKLRDSVLNICLIQRWQIILCFQERIITGPTKIYFSRNFILNAFPFPRTSGSHRGGYEETYPLGHNALDSGRSRPTRLCLLPVSWWFRAWLIRHAKDECDMFLRNVGWFSLHYMVSLPRRKNSSPFLFLLVLPDT